MGGVALLAVVPAGPPCSLQKVSRVPPAPFLLAGTSWRQPSTSWTRIPQSGAFTTSWCALLGAWAAAGGSRAQRCLGPPRDGGQRSRGCCCLPPTTSAGTQPSGVARGGETGGAVGERRWAAVPRCLQGRTRRPPRPPDAPAPTPHLAWGGGRRGGGRRGGPGKRGRPMRRRAHWAALRPTASALLVCCPRPVPSAPLQGGKWTWGCTTEARPRGGREAWEQGAGAGRLFPVLPPPTRCPPLLAGVRQLFLRLCLHAHQGRQPDHGAGRLVAAAAAGSRGRARRCRHSHRVSSAAHYLLPAPCLRPPNHSSPASGRCRPGTSTAGGATT